ncbi:MAG TPA: hypothetical protein DDW23_02475, partial [Planctomycetes bacterium]|nr:hypothetical protein [Planctomycetota bacterium]
MKRLINPTLLAALFLTAAPLSSTFAQEEKSLWGIKPTATEDASAPTVDAELGKKMARIQVDLIKHDITGSNVALVVKDGKTIYHQAVNSGKKGDKDISEKALFPIWSMSKPITIVAMMTLHEKGLFDWNDPVSDYIPCFENLTVWNGKEAIPAKEPLRVVHLMTHRSGYTYYNFPGPMPPTYESPHPNQTRYHDLQDFVEAVAKTPLWFEPGARYAYGINQAILGRLAEVLSGKSFSEYLEEALFEPLGMSQTSFVLDQERSTRFQPLFINNGEIKGFTFLLNELTYSPTSQAHFGGEGLVSTLGDYSRFCEMLVNGGVFRGKRILSEESIAKMTETSTADFDPNGAPGADMGFSLFVFSDAKKEGNLAPKGIYGWSGYHNTHFWIDPTTNLYAIFMSRAREFNWGIPRSMRAAIYG